MNGPAPNTCASFSPRTAYRMVGGGNDPTPAGPGGGGSGGNDDEDDEDNQTVE